MKKITLLEILEQQVTTVLQQSWLKRAWEQDAILLIPDVDGISFVYYPQKHGPFHQYFFQLTGILHPDGKGYIKLNIDAISSNRIEFSEFTTDSLKSIKDILIGILQGRIKARIGELKSIKYLFVITITGKLGVTLQELKSLVNDLVELALA